MPGYTFTAFDRIPEKDLVRVGYRYRDILEGHGCRNCSQKLIAWLLPTIGGWVYFKEYQMKYGHYPILRASALITQAPIRQQIHYALPIALFSVSFWWAELVYNRCALGIQGAEPLPDEVITRSF